MKPPPPRRASTRSPGGARELPPLPHELDQRTDRPPAKRTATMIVAADDVEQGQSDTDCRSATPAPACPQRDDPPVTPGRRR